MNSQEPLFKSVFGEQWQKLPAILQLRYANRPYSSDVVTLEGKLDIYLSPLMKMLMPVLNLFKAFVPYQGNMIPVQVNIRSKPNTSEIFFERTFYYPNQTVCFSSFLQVLKENSVIEFLHSSLGWRMKYSFNGEKVLLEHNSYVYKIFGKIIPLPLNIFLGKLNVEETAIDKNSFQMRLQITHSLFGKMFEYKGEFKLIENRVEH